MIAFMESEGYVHVEKGAKATSKSLYQAYGNWCGDNAETPVTQRNFSTYLSQNQERYGIRYSTNVPSETGKKARGFTGIRVEIKGCRSDHAAGCDEPVHRMHHGEICHGHLLSESQGNAQR